METRVQIVAIVVSALILLGAAAPFTGRSARLGVARA